MARIAVAMTVGSTNPSTPNFGGPTAILDPVGASSFATDQTAFETALATLVADGASPTQAHVNAANSAYTTLKGDFGVPLAAGRDLIVSVDLAKVKSASVLRLALDRMARALGGTSYLTP